MMIGWRPGASPIRPSSCARNLPRLSAASSNCNPRVGGSSPSTATNDFRDLDQNHPRTQPALAPSNHQKCVSAAIKKQHHGTVQASSTPYCFGICSAVLVL